ncbi:cob(I)yrinic acid a,c-diamide adenosyltransferase [Selenomonas ruminis]|uniref:Corrinoid adenosyltransferase n=1 Tax=Selenomonas ruminis TaxID=2593411 RepID=A0A5D6WEQ0_9FIRM|nr:cob(I)yrinic acid a,c-diamide adenosyltransferase [Selenomonas sp. mPRGC5]TYZ24914.1 cob(I)yrinic acid a,c-diamide adenosyltransferase [Selenomonas sp. mPRGC5]
MSVTTKTGDKGMTSLYTGERVDKGCLRVEVYGTIDEAGSALSMARAFAQKPEVKDRILALQKQLSLLMADFASLGKTPYITAETVADIEGAIAALEEKLPPLNCFLIPGDTKAGAMLDMARTIARRAERAACRLAQETPVAESDRLFLNRVSDYCFLLMRCEEHE